MMSDYVINCGEVDESTLVGSSIREAVKWAVDMVGMGRRALVIMGEPGSGKTTALLLIMRKLRGLGIPTVYINAYNELGIKSVKLVGCDYDPNARVLLIDDIDAVFTVPRISQGFVNKVLNFNGSIIASLTVPLLVGNDLESLEHLIRFLHSALRFSIVYRDDELKMFAQRIGVNYSNAIMKTPGIILRNFRKWGNRDTVLSNVLSDGNVLL